MHFRQGRKYITALAIALVFVLFFGGASKEAVRFNKEGLRLLKEKKYEEAAEAFTKLLVYAPENDNAKKNLAYAYSGLATELFYQGGEQNIERAIGLFKRASELMPDTDVYRMSLSVVLTTKGKYLYDQKQLEEAWPCILEALEQDPNNVDAWIILGDISFYRQRIAEAREYWLKALSLNPASALVSQRIKDLNLSYDLEKEFKKLNREHFIITYDGELERNEIYDICDMLKDAYREVGQDVGFFPLGDTVVVLYRGKSFLEYIDSPKWTVALYDGKMRIPVVIGDDMAKYKGIVYHEYTHALIHVMTGEMCPIWLNEGLACYEENRFHERSANELKKALKDNKIIPIGGLDDAFRNYEDLDRITLAYQESLYLVKHIIDRYNWAGVIGLLKDFSKDPDVKKVIEERLNISFDEFQRNWIGYMKKELL